MDMSMANNIEMIVYEDEWESSSLKLALMFICYEFQLQIFPVKAIDYCRYSTFAVDKYDVSGRMYTN